MDVASAAGGTGSSSRALQGGNNSLLARGTPGPGLWVSLLPVLGIKQFKQK